MYHRMFRFLTLLSVTIGLIAGCEQVNVKLYTDGNLLLQSEQIQSTLLPTSNHELRRLSDQTRIDINTIGKEIYHVYTISFPPDDGWLERVNSRLLNVPPTSDTISSHELERDINSYFTYSKYRSVAEIVVIIVSSTTSLERIPLSLLKKKIIVVVIGGPASEQWKNVSSRKDHLFALDRTEDLANISEQLIDTICTDSKFYCDTDQLSRSKGAPCKNCSGNACPEDPTDKSSTCDARCPYFRRTDPNEVVIENKNDENIELSANVKDNKPTAINATIIVLGTIGAVGFVASVGIFVCMRKRQQRTDVGNLGRPVTERDVEDSESSETQQKLLFINETTPLQETQGAHGGMDSSTNLGLTVEEIAVSLRKNVAEFKMNLIATGDPQFYDIQKDKAQAGIMQ